MESSQHIITIQGKADYIQFLIMKAYDLALEIDRDNRIVLYPRTAEEIHQLLHHLREAHTSAGIIKNN